MELIQLQTTPRLCMRALNRQLNLSLRTRRNQTRIDTEASLWDCDEHHKERVVVPDTVMLRGIHYIDQNKGAQMSDIKKDVEPANASCDSTEDSSLGEESPDRNNEEAAQPVRRFVQYLGLIIERAEESVECGQ